LTSQQNEIIVIGAGGHARSIIDVIEDSSLFKIAGIIDNNLKLGEKILNYEVIGCDEDLKKLRQKYKYAVIGIGHIKSNEIRKKMFHLLKQLGFILPVIVSKRAYVSKHTFIDEGSVILHLSMINANTKIGKNCIINSKALIEHDVIIKDNCHIATGAIVNGGVVIGQDSFIGSGSVIQEYAVIKSNSFIKANSLYKRE